MYYTSLSGESSATKLLSSDGCDSSTRDLASRVSSGRAAATELGAVFAEKTAITAHTATATNNRVTVVTRKGLILDLLESPDASIGWPFSILAIKGKREEPIKGA